MSTNTLTWTRYPSVTTGGKPFFYYATAAGERVGAVVWHRGRRAYAVAYCGQAAGWAGSVNEGKAIVRRIHNGGGK